MKTAVSISDDIPRVRASPISAGAEEPVRKEDFDHQFVVVTNLDLYSSEIGLTWDEPAFMKAEGLMF